MFYYFMTVLSAMVISSLGGTILNQTIIRFPKVAAYQPVINGVAGNLVAVNASRISTSLHQQQKDANSRPDTPTRRLHRISSCEYSDNQSSSEKELPDLKIESKSICLLLWLLVVPGHLVFNLFIYIFTSENKVDVTEPVNPSLNSNETEVLFLFLYLIAALIQVGILLYASQPLVMWLWRKGIDPDSSSIPYLTSSGDLLGGIVLSAAFHLNDFLQ